jgi:hypothetical protein
MCFCLKYNRCLLAPLVNNGNLCFKLKNTFDIDSLSPNGEARCKLSLCCRTSKNRGAVVAMMYTCDWSSVKDCKSSFFKVKVLSIL